MSDPFTYAVIGKAMEVHRELGPGLDEIFYHDLLSERLSTAGIEHLCRPQRQLTHRGIVADTFEADLVFPGNLVVELKCLRGAFEPEHYVQLFCYLKFWRVRTGLLFDFAKDALLQQRVNHSPATTVACEAAAMLSDAPKLNHDRELGFLLCDGIGHVVGAHGLGYRDTTYRGLLAAEFNARTIPCAALPVATVLLNGRQLGETRCDCLTVGGRFGVKVLSLRRAISAADVAVLRTHLRLLELPYGLIVNFGKTEVEHCWVLGPFPKGRPQRLEEDEDEVNP